ncbi:MAG: hypothetical protein BRD57_04560 [Proteobacteria bacterium SW_6_67_9]|nr:MAG: hypothetical protein BRD57_04560 [Proteobacteria bacterium SW_6_67_9]
MSPRKRTGKSRGLPANLYAVTKRGRTYYRYQRPDTGEWRGAGYDRQAAIRAAKRANEQLTPAEPVSEAAYQRMVSGDGLAIEDLGERFKSHLREVTDSRGRRRAGKTLYEYDRMVDRAVTAWAGRDAGDITRADVTAFLEPFGGRSYGAYRTVLHQLFAYFVATSDRDDNPVAGTLTKPHVVERTRLTQAEFDAVREHAPPWLANAMDLSLVTLQARAEIAAMRFDDERQAGYLFVDRAARGHPALPRRYRLAVHGPPAAEPPTPRILGAQGALDGRRARHAFARVPPGARRGGSGRASGAPPAPQLPRSTGPGRRPATGGGLVQGCGATPVRPHHRGYD